MSAAHKRRSAARALAKYTPQSHKVRCTVCGKEAVVETVGVQISIWGGHWLRAPKGWWLAVGITVQELTREGAGGVRCPDCFAGSEAIDAQD